MVGTVDYIAPEVFNKDGYTHTVDWWSLGTILFEMLLGYPPFYGNDPSTTLKNVMHFKKCLKIPKEAQISRAAVDILHRLISSAEERLGRNGVDEIKDHPFFAGVDWENIKSTKAPIIPKLSSPEDTCNFEKFEDPLPWVSEMADADGPRSFGKHRDYYWIGYTYKRPQTFDNKKEIEEIFEKLKKKKENEYKRMFSEDKLEMSYKDRSYFHHNNHNVSNLVHEEAKPPSKVYNFSKKSKLNEYTESNPNQAPRFTLNINDKYCYSMTEGEYNTNSTKGTAATKKSSGLSNFQSKASEKSRLIRQRHGRE